MSPCSQMSVLFFQAHISFLEALLTSILLNSYRFPGSTVIKTIFTYVLLLILLNIFITNTAKVVQIVRHKGDFNETLGGLVVTIVE